ncbi:hypothetical protein [Burkholderia anthina]|uniref:hypothetical protein n=1 Tax=Burkholderia anthina TaxID=179879 RepID=UPI001AA04112|nr:hypothetical protein [Burkholderia anthina]QTD94850.1 hypothetical protein J4G50_32965 [Burkholderia anthina]
MEHVSLLCRYPVKGLSAETLSSVPLSAGQGFPSDRRHAIANGEWDFDAASFVPRPKTDFLRRLRRDRERRQRQAWRRDRAAMSRQFVFDPAA